MAHRHGNGLRQAVFVDEGHFAGRGPVGGHIHVDKAVRFVRQIIEVRQILGPREHDPGAFAEGLHAVGQDGHAVLIHIVDGDLDGMHHPAVIEGDFRQAAAFQGDGQRIGEGLLQDIVAFRDSRRGHDLMVALAVGLVGILGNGLAQLVHVVHGDHDRAHQALVGKHHFLLARAIHVHHELDGGGLNKRVFILGDDGVGGDDVHAGGQGLHLVGRDGFAQVVHIADHNVHRLGGPLIGEGDLGGVRAVGGNEYVIGDRIDQKVIFGRNVRRGVYGAPAGLHGRGGIRGERRAVLVHVMEDDLRGQHLPGIGEEDLRGMRAFQIDRYVHGSLGRKHIAVKLLGLHRAVPGGQRQRFIRGQAVARVVHIIDGHACGLDAAGVAEGELAGRRAGAVHIHQEIAFAGYVVAVDLQRRHQMRAFVQVIDQVVHQGDAVFILEMHGHRRGRDLTLIKERHFVHARAVGVHRDGVAFRPDGGVALDRLTGNGLFALVQRHVFVGQQGLIVFVQITDQDIHRNGNAGKIEGHVAHGRAVFVHGDLVAVLAGNGIAFDGLAGDEVRALVQGNGFVGL